MARVHVEKLVQLPADQCYAIAADVASYKEFVPLVKRSTIRGNVQSEGAQTKFAADLLIVIDRMNINESFTSIVVADAEAKTVTATSSQGPVKSLKAIWTIRPVSKGQSNVAVEIDYQFKNMLLQIAAGSFVNMAVQKVLDAFEMRGQQLYPPFIA